MTQPPVPDSTQPPVPSGGAVPVPHRAMGTLERRLSSWGDRIENLARFETTPDRVVEIDTDNRIAHRPIVVGLAVILVVLGTFLLWAVLAPLESAAIAPGTVVVDSNRKTIQHLEGGIIEKILVAEGDYVVIGQPLVRLSETAAKARDELLRAQLLTAMATEARLLAERDGLEEIAFPEEFKETMEEAEIKEVVDTQKRILSSRRNATMGQINVLDQRIKQLEEEIIGMEAQEKSTRRQLSLIKEEVGMISTLVRQGNAPKSRLLALQRRQSELEGTRGEYLANIARAKQSITEAKLSKINVQNDYTKEVVSELKEIIENTSTLREQINASQDVLQRIEIISPINGIVQDLHYHTAGGVVTPGAEIMDIVPAQDKRVIEAKVSPQDIDVVHVGLPARVRLSAYKTRQTPDLAGELIHVSADRSVNERTGEVYYKARVAIDQASLDKLKNVELYPGMPADVMIVTGERTLFSYLISPITDSFWFAFKEQ